MTPRTPERRRWLGGPPRNARQRTEPPGATRNDAHVTDGIGSLIEDHVRCDALLRRVDGSGQPDEATVRLVIQELSVHDAVESEYLYPLVEDRLPAGNQLAVESLSDHASMARMLVALGRSRTMDPSHRRALWAELTSACHSHFAAEEELLLAPLRQHLAPEELVRLGQDLCRARRKAPSRPHPHAPRFSVGTRLAATTLRPIDRLRNTLQRH
jgi:hypothetical protein